MSAVHFLIPSATVAYMPMPVAKENKNLSEVEIYATTRRSLM